MPELPEVETVRRTLAPVIGRRIESVWASRQKLRERLIPRARLARASTGARIEGIRRWGKYLLVDFIDRPAVMVVHLGMTGRLRVHANSDARVDHTHLVMGLSGRSELRYSDPRRFGHISVAERGREQEHPPLSVLGIDALTGTVDGAMLHEHTRRSRRMMKAFLLDQSVVAGLGNIYVCEVLWRARVRPTLRAHRLSRRRCGSVADAIGAVLDNALDRGGTSLRDFVAADGAKGENSHYLRVYDREGSGCLRRTCAGEIRRTLLQGRATFYCPTCQSH